MLDSNRWIINRAGLINFWYYDEEVFDFSDGKLLLRGSNGSGKSVTMQSFIPLLLDGNKSPERLDPFGSKARRLENYLLGEEDNGKDENTGYLFMEFKKTQTENLLTIGMGMKAVRGKPLQSWGFCITDGRRIGHDFYLYKNVGEKIPLTKKELENRIGGGGQVCDTSGDYMKMVNNMLFGFENAEEYDELIKLLVNLRSPKLSKDFKPTVIYEIMENSLQPLSEDDLRPMSEAIENMDNIKSKLDELKESKKAAEKIQAAYDRYNNHILLDKAKAFFNCGVEIEKTEKEKTELESKIASSQQAYIEAEVNLDYKKWFEFKLYFIKTGQAKKELTNNAFYQFSGGEKAMAMYVPLFSAVYARYQGARKDCPRIISLDEAFAGVDEKNIRDMFRLLGELELDFIINSQILWGDYDTVPSLSICELLRPDNADFVTVIRYHWDGKVKSLLT